MKKRYGLLAVALAFVFVTGCAAPVDQPQGDSATLSATITTKPNESQAESTTASNVPATMGDIKQSATENTQRITPEEARNIALTAAGVTESTVTGLKVELDYDDDARRWEYEVDFRAGNREYDIDIDAASGNILRNEIDGEPTTTPTQATDLITREQAKALALERVQVTEAQISDYEIELDYDDDMRRWEYEISFNVGRTEYECEINAENGTIIYLNKEIDD